VANAYQKSYGLNIATARAGNVIGGGDFATDRLVPDFVRSIIKKKPIKVRHPSAVRPWQHVLEPLVGYLLLAEKTMTGAWNFGPTKKDIKTVGWVVKSLGEKWGVPVSSVGSYSALHEARHLALDSRKAMAKLGWQPKLRLEQALDRIVDWTNDYLAGANMREVTIKQIQEYLHG